MERNGDRIWKVIQVGAWIILAIVFYFGQTMVEHDAIATLKVEVATTKQAVSQELEGYKALIGTVGERMTRLENKLDRVVEQHSQNHQRGKENPL